MIMRTLLHYRRPIIGGLLPLLCLLLLNTAGWAGLKADGNSIKTTEVKWNVKGDMIVINYDLNTDPDLKFRIDVLMRSENDSTFSAVPRTVEGDIGEGYFAGSNREIRWHYRRDFPQGFEGEGYFFEIRIQEHENEESSPFLYYALGAAVVAGGVLAFMMSQRQEELTSVPTR